MNPLTLSEVKARNSANGMFWFSRSAMKFFRTKIHGGLRKGKYFITSEQCGDFAPRKFSVRFVADPLKCNIGTLGTFNSYLTIEEAKEAINQEAA